MKNGILLNQTLVEPKFRRRFDKFESKGETRYKSYVLCQEVEFLSSKKTNVEKEYVDNFSVKTETQETTEYTDEDLPW